MKYSRERKSVMRNARLSVLVLGCLSASSSCNKPEKKSSSAGAASQEAVEVSSGAPSKVNKKIEESLVKGSQKPEPNDESAPPRDGLLSAERADKEGLPGSVSKLTKGAQGAEPLVVLRSVSADGRNPATDKVAPRAAVAGKVEVAVRTGPNAALPTVVFNLKSEIVKSETKEGATQSSSVSLVAPSVGLGSEQPGVIPDKLAQQIALLKGSTISFMEEAGQTLGALSYKRSKSAPVEGDLLLEAAVAALDAALVSLPTEPIGKDGFYMSTSRTRFLNSDVVSYQMVKVLSVAEQQVELEINTRRYLVGSQLAVQGLEGTRVVQFQSADKVQLIVRPGQRYPQQAVVQQQTVALVETSQGKAPFQFDSHATVAFGTGTKP